MFLPFFTIFVSKDSNTSYKNKKISDLDKSLELLDDVDLNYTALIDSNLPLVRLTKANALSYKARLTKKELYCQETIKILKELTEDKSWIFHEKMVNSYNAILKNKCHMDKKLDKK